MLYLLLTKHQVRSLIVLKIITSSAGQRHAVQKRPSGNSIESRGGLQLLLHCRKISLARRCEWCNSSQLETNLRHRYVHLRQRMTKHLSIAHWPVCELPSSNYRASSFRHVRAMLSAVHLCHLKVLRNGNKKNKSLQTAGRLRRAVAIHPLRL